MSDKISPENKSLLERFTEANGISLSEARAANADARRQDVLNARAACGIGPPSGCAPIGSLNVQLRKIRRRRLDHGKLSERRLKNLVAQAVAEIMADLPDAVCQLVSQAMASERRWLTGKGRR